jgi:predicted nucleic acid-binding protein
MITAVDSSVILDVVTGGHANTSSSLAALRKASREGRLIVSESVIAEVRPVFESNDLFQQFLGDWGLEFMPSTLRSSIRAGEMLRQMLTRKKRHEGRILPDFLIGAHALEHADRLLARDRGFLRDYFTELAVWDPSR